MQRRSASLSDTIVEEVVSVGEGTWGPAEAGADHQAEGFLAHRGGPRPASGADSEVAEEAVISLILNTG